MAASEADDATVDHMDNDVHVAGEVGVGITMCALKVILLWQGVDTAADAGGDLDDAHIDSGCSYLAEAEAEADPILAQVDMVCTYSVQCNVEGAAHNKGVAVAAEADDVIGVIWMMMCMWQGRWVGLCMCGRRMLWVLHWLWWWQL